MRAHIAVKEAKIKFEWATVVARCPDNKWRAFDRLPRLLPDKSDWDYSLVRSEVLDNDDKWTEDVFNITR